MTKVVLLIFGVFGLSGGLISLARGNGFGELIAAIGILGFFSIATSSIANNTMRGTPDEALRPLARLGKMSVEELRTRKEMEARFGSCGCAVCCLMAGIILFVFSIVVDRL